MVPIHVRADYLHLAINLGILALCVAPLGGYLSRVFRGEPIFFAPLMSWFETRLYDWAGVEARADMSWRTYALSAVLFSGLGFVALYLVLIFQAVLPGAGHAVQGFSPGLAFNTSAGFVTNAGQPLQSDAGALSPLSQMAGLTVQNFLSTAVSLSVFIAVTRGIARTTPGTIGNFWVDVVRSLLYVLLPLSLAYALLLATAGVGDAVEAYAVRNLLHPSATAGDLQAIATLETLKLTVTSEGSFINANNAHLTNVSTPLAQLLDWLSRWLLPSALCWTFGNMTGAKRHTYLLMAGAATLLAISAAASGWLETEPPISLFGLMDGNGIVLYCLIATLIATVVIRKGLFGQAASFLDHRLSLFDITMAATALLVPTIIVTGLLLIRDLNIQAGPLPSLADPIGGLGTLISRFWIMIPALAIAGSFATATAPFSKGVK